MTTLPRIEYAKYFQTKTRLMTQGKLICLVDEAPEDLSELIQWIHKSYFLGALPNDWIYSTIQDAFYDLQDNEFEDISIECDVYNNQLAEWLKEPYANEYCIQAAEELGAKNNIFDAIGQGQSMAKQAIYDAVNEFIQKDNE